MYAVTSMPVVSRTRATLRSAEFGFFGVWVKTRVHTPRRWGDPWSAGVFDFSGLVTRPLRTSCWMVGNVLLEPLLGAVWGTEPGGRVDRLQNSRWTDRTDPGEAGQGRRTSIAVRGPRHASADRRCHTSPWDGGFGM